MLANNDLLFQRVSCHYCQSFFDTTEERRVHVERVHGPEEQCQHCGYRVLVGEQDRMDRHMSRQHPEEMRSSATASRCRPRPEKRPRNNRQPSPAKPSPAKSSPPKPVQSVVVAVSTTQKREDTPLHEPELDFDIYQTVTRPTAQDPTPPPTPGRLTPVEEGPTTDQLLEEWRQEQLEMSRPSFPPPPIEEPEVALTDDPRRLLDEGCQACKLRRLARQAGYQRVHALPPTTLGLLRVERVTLPDGTMYEVEETWIPHPRNRKTAMRATQTGK